MISAKIICDSLSPQGHRITTFELVFPRFILAELNTHRLFSKNSASSRAIPFSKMVKAVEENPFIPIAWQKQHSGMQGSEYLYGIEAEVAERNWEVAKDNAIRMATHLHESGITKQLCNRLLEPFLYHKVLLTATEFDNFFELRCPQYHTPVSGEGFYFKSKKECIKNHSNPENIAKLEAMSDLDWLQINKGQSEIHMMALAECMWDAMNESIPKQLKAGEWHIPYGNTFTKNAVLREMKYNPTVSNIATADEMFEYYSLRIATAKCARTSYTTVGEDGKEIPYEKDIALHDSLIASGHMSPTEHIAVAMSNEEYYDFIKGKKVVTHSEPEYDDLYEFDKTSIGWCLNYRGFIQYRYLLQNK